MSLIGTLGGMLVSNRFTTYRIEQLEKRVYAHNNLFDRTYALERETTLVNEKIRVVNHRIDDLERMD